MTARTNLVHPTPIADLVPKRPALAHGVVVHYGSVNEPPDRDGVGRPVRTIHIRDATGEIPLTLWNDQVGHVRDADRVLLVEAWVRVNETNGRPELSLGSRGYLVNHGPAGGRGPVWRPDPRGCPYVWGLVRRRLRERKLHARSAPGKERPKLHNPRNAFSTVPEPNSDRTSSRDVGQVGANEVPISERHLEHGSLRAASNPAGVLEGTGVPININEKPHPGRNGTDGERWTSDPCPRDEPRTMLEAKGKFEVKSIVSQPILERQLHLQSPPKQDSCYGAPIQAHGNAQKGQVGETMLPEDDHRQGSGKDCRECEAPTSALPAAGDELVHSHSSDSQLLRPSSGGGKQEAAHVA